MAAPPLSGIGAFLVYLAYSTSVSTSLGVFSLQMLVSLMAAMGGIQAYQQVLDELKTKNKPDPEEDAISQQ